MSQLNNVNFLKEYTFIIGIYFLLVLGWNMIWTLFVRFTHLWNGQDMLSMWVSSNFSAQALRLQWNFIQQWRFCLLVCVGWRQRWGWDFIVCGIWSIKTVGANTHTHTHTYMHAELISRWVESLGKLGVLLSCMQSCHHPENATMNISRVPFCHSVALDLSVNTAVVESDPLLCFSLHLLSPVI